MISGETRHNHRHVQKRIEYQAIHGVCYWILGLDYTRGRRGTAVHLAQSAKHSEINIARLG